MSCTCEICAECEGTGNVWFAFPGPDRGGKYLGNHRSDDLDELETCEWCHGSGIAEMCDECRDAEEQFEAENWR